MAEEVPKEQDVSSQGENKLPSLSRERHVRIQGENGDQHGQGPSSQTLTQRVPFPRESSTIDLTIVGQNFDDTKEESKIDIHPTASSPGAGDENEKSLPRLPRLNTLSPVTPVGRLLRSRSTVRSLTRPARSNTVRSRRSMLHTDDDEKATLWKKFSWAVTFWAPGAILSRCGIKQPEVQQAWREKIALCVIILFISGILTFNTIGLRAFACNGKRRTDFFNTADTGWAQPRVVVIHGDVFNLSMGNFLSYHSSLPLYASNSVNATEVFNIKGGTDLSSMFPVAGDPCTKVLSTTYQQFCNISGVRATHCHNWETASAAWESINIGSIAYTWDDVRNVKRNLMIYNGRVLNMTAYLALNKSIFINNIDSVIRASSGTDATLALTKVNLDIGACLLAMFNVAALEHETLGCIATDIVVWISLIVVIGVLSIRFVCAIFFQWFISWQLGQLRKKNLEGGAAALQKTPETHEQALRRTMSRRAAMGRSARRRRTETRPAPIPSSDQPRTSFDTSTTPSPHNEVEGEDLIRRRVTRTLNIGKLRQSMIAINPYESEFGEELYTILLVTCYSEDVQGLRATIDSLATTTFSDDKKLLFIVADGLIKGAGNDMTTPDIVLSLLELDPLWKDPMPQEYLAIGSGKNRENRAKVYVGWYEPEGTGRLIPAVVIVKCGREDEATSAKPGNRGKRDSQMILMSFFQRVLLNERFTPLDFDLFTKMHYLMGVTPDHFEVVLMVDADTKVAPDALSRMVACMSRDPKIMGLCGETRIANKRQSWVTRIQVFEYYISHHLAKAFESVFGGVTCLPGCFCMYRIKAPTEDNRWIPIICSPTITLVYSQCEVTTLHQKNLLLLGEDRFLTTLMLRTFPRRSLIFVPKAFCKTVVPDTLQVLLSQRRRWINSTIHNLLELVLVNELCGTFCFSMQFVIMLELVGTVSLPAALVLTLYMLASAFLSPIVPVAQLMLLLCILLAPSLLVAMSTFRLTYIYWLGIYLIALPVWNVLLPLYAFWHFDDFSWGQTRKVEGETAQDGHHGHGGGNRRVEVNVKQMHWEEWETDRRKQILDRLKVSHDYIQEPEAGLIALPLPVFVPNVALDIPGSESLNELPQGSEEIMAGRKD